MITLRVIDLRDRLLDLKQEIIGRISQKRLAYYELCDENESEQKNTTIHWMECYKELTMRKARKEVVRWYTCIRNNVKKLNLTYLSKRNIWAYSFTGEKATGFALFISIFLRYQFLSKARWFYGKKRRIWKGNLYLSKHRLSRNEI